MTPAEQKIIAFSSWRAATTARSHPSAKSSAMQTRLVDLRTIETTETLLPYDKQDARVLIDWANTVRQQGASIFLSRSAAEDRDFESWLNAGLIVLRSQVIDVEILLIKARANERVQRHGRVYQTFLGNYTKDLWGEGAMFRSLNLGLNVIAGFCTSASENSRNLRPIVESYG